ncbi:MAG: dTDP-4-dehydrorhamnose 3,5-epimerase family protein [Cryobacterium sp.]|nr:dTDP-4-dehydrorhamnose 3,5-epimerase family protein [Cryobacterium sp.]
MQIRELAVPGAFEVTPLQHADSRGLFIEWFRADLLSEATGRQFDLAQSNLSVSARGVARGIHYSDVPPGQAKYVTVVAGAGMDFVVDLRVGSPTFGQFDRVELSADNRVAVFLAEGIGHAFISLMDGTALNYLTTDVYKPQADRTVSLLDPELALELPLRPEELILSEKDRLAPGLSDAGARGLLPNFVECELVYSAHQIGARA